MTHILVVDDDDQVRKLLRSRFEKDGFSVSEACNAVELRAGLETHAVDLITLDLTLGRDDGLALAREIRASRNVPIIMISAKDDEIDRVVGLELGADDYIVKPFSPREVVARVKAVLRRYGADAPPAAQNTNGEVCGTRLSFDGGVLDTARRELVAPAGTAIALTTTEFNLLELFLRHPQRVMSRDEIMNQLKGHDWSAFDRSVDSAIARLRKKIEPDADRPRHIKTVRSIGYVFSSDVRKV
ncbi:MAG: response regulator [Hyphomicrobiaceae bacterium]